ncbi:MAG TPA: fluoride efflux transporter CrcB [Acidimicrobiia bacterium]|nr:fluoride efflux transporter CrcB [Acidimicrobiia bacterium]
MILVGVIVAGAMGAPARLLLERVVSARFPRAFPWGTLIVNLTGSFALGLLVGATLDGGVSDGTRTVLGTGFLGSYTTFSTYAYEVVKRAEDGRRRAAVTYAFASVIFGSASAGLGLALAGA